MKQNRSPWRDLFGPAPESFSDAIESALEQIETQEETKTMKKFRLSTALTAAALLIVLGTGAAFAASRMGILDYFSRGQVKPLQEAQQLIVAAPPQQTQPPLVPAGAQEEELVTVSLEEMVCDGQSAALMLRLTPKDPATQAIYTDALEDNLDEKIYDWSYTYDSQGNQTSGHLMGRKDGKTLLYCSLQTEVTNLGTGNASAAGPLFNSMNAVSQEDGSVLYYMSGESQEPLPETLDLRITLRYGEYDPSKPFDSASALDHETVLTASTKTKDPSTLTAVLTPEGEASGERFTVLSGDLSMTPLAGHIRIDYIYQPAQDEEMGIDFRIYTPDGERLPTGEGGLETIPQTDGTVVYRRSGTLQPLETLPETLILEAKVIGEEKTLGRVTVKVIQQ